MINKLLFHAILTLAHLAGSWCFGADFKSGDFDHRLVGQYKIGGAFIGAGDGQYVKPGTQLRGEMTVIRDPSSEPLCTLPGAFWRLEGMTLLGDGHQVGLLIDGTGRKGIGTGKHTIRNVTFQNCGSAIQFGTDLDTANCDNCAFDKVTAIGCDTVATFENAMAFGNSFEHTRCVNVRDVFRFHAGGKFLAEDTFIATLNEPASVLHLVGTQVANNKGRIEKGFGNNSDHFTLRNTRSDTQCGSKLRLLSLDTHCEHGPTIVFDGGHVAYDDYRQDGEYQIAVKNPATIVLRDFDNLQAGTIYITHDPKRPPVRILLSNCELAGGDLNQDGRFDAADLLVDPKVPVWLTARDCHDVRGNSLENVYWRGEKLGDAK